MSDGQAHRDFQLGDYLRMLLRRKWIILAFGVVVIVSTAILTARQQKEFLAVITLNIDMAPLRVVEFDESTNPSSVRNIEFQSYYNTQYQIISSRTIKLNAIEKLQMKGFKDWDKSADPVADFEGRMQIIPVRETRLVKIGYVHTDPEKAAEIANTIAQVYMDAGLERKLGTVQRADKWLTEQAQRWREKKRESDMALLDYKHQNDLLTSQEKEGIFQKNLASIYDAYNKARADRISVESEFRTLQEYYKKHEYDALATYFATDIVRGLKGQYNDVDRQYQALSERYLPRFPQMVRLDTERKALEKKLHEELGRIMKGKEADYQLRVGKETSLLSEFERVKQQASEIEEKMVRYDELLNESDRNERFFKQLDKRQSEIDIVGLLRNSNIEVIDQATSPTRHIRPNMVLNLLMAIMVGLIGGTALAFALDYLDLTFKSLEDVEFYLRVPLLGIVPSIDPKTIGAARDTFVFHNPKSSVAECCRSIRTNLLLGAGAKRIQTLMVTSAAPREGKSTLVVNLGITLATSDIRTLIVDTDLRRPRLHRVFDLENKLGVSALLNQEVSVEEAVQKTQVPNLFFLPSGSVPTNPAEIVGGEKMQALIKLLSSHFDMVIFDSPPCIAVTDPVVLSSLTDGVIFVIRQDTTTREIATEGVRRLREVSDTLLGCVVNNVDMDRSAYAYRHYYYHYHYYGEDSEEKT